MRPGCMVQRRGNPASQRVALGRAEQHRQHNSSLVALAISQGPERQVDRVLERAGRDQVGAVRGGQVIRVERVIQLLDTRAGRASR